MPKHPYTVIKNAKLISGGMSATRDILIKNKTYDSDSVIAEIAPKIDESLYSASIYDAAGRPVLPGFVDIHCHLRDPGFEYKEDIVSGTLAAACGGYSAVVCMPNTNPVIDNVTTLSYVIKKAKNLGACRVFPTAAITVGQKGTTLCDFKTLADAGAVAFTDDGHPVSDPAIMYEAMKECAKHDYLIISHPEELSLAEGGAVNEGKVSAHFGVKGIPNAAEDAMIARDIVLAEATGCRLHLAHVSTKGGMQLVREAKARGVRVTAETCPHYFSLCDEDVVFYGNNAKMNPPLRSKEDVAAVIEAIKDGTVDCISTDHAPHSALEKSGSISEALCGITGLQTAFSAAMTYLVMPGHIDLSRLCELMCYNPASIIGIDCGIEVGKRADLSIVSVSKDIIITKNYLKSKSFNTPFLGQTLCGTIDDVFINEWL